MRSPIAALFTSETRRPDRRSRSARPPRPPTSRATRCMISHRRPTPNMALRRTTSPSVGSAAAARETATCAPSARQSVRSWQQMAHSFQRDHCPSCIWRTLPATGQDSQSRAVRRPDRRRCRQLRDRSRRETPAFRECPPNSNCAFCQWLFRLPGTCSLDTPELLFDIT